MARKTLDPLHEELKAVLEGLVARNEDITARAVSRLHSSVGDASGHGAYPIDNNACENSISPFVIGHPAWLFADTVAGANASANLYSLLQTCTANGVDGYRYLRALLVALPTAHAADDYEALLPWSIAMPAD